MWQEILIIIIGIAVFVYAVWKIIRLFTKKDTSPCSGCTISCAIKDTKTTTKKICKK